MSDEPVRQPFITDALVARIHSDNEETGKRDRAFHTYFRHSDATKCARAMAYAYREVTDPTFADSNPPDLAGEWVMWLGTNIHEHVQSALHDRFGSACEVEVKVKHDDISSGHIDAVIEKVPGIGRVAYELKTKGAYGFDKAVGINRRSYKTELPEGPGYAAKCQGALNAIAVDADLLVIGVIGMEAISRQLAERVGWEGVQRFIGEWHYTKAEYRPWASNELTRFEQVAAYIDKGLLPPREAVGDEGEPLNLNPEASRPDWRCSYCNHFDTCRKDGA